MKMMFRTDGSAQFILKDALQTMLTKGNAVVKRASHVEPTMVNGKWVWEADMAPSKGPILGPFNTRQEALDAEVEWIEKNIILV